MPPDDLSAPGNSPPSDVTRAERSAAKAVPDGGAARPGGGLPGAGLGGPGLGGPGLGGTGRGAAVPGGPGRGLRTAERRMTSSRVASQLYYNIASLRVVNDPIAIQFVASQPSEGTSLVAGQFAAFAAGVEGGSALLIDCATPPRWRAAAEQRPTLVEVFGKTARIDAAIAPYGLSGQLDGAALSAYPNSILHTDPAALGAVLDQARQRYRMTVLETPSLAESPGTLVFSRACDAVVLVVEAEKTPADVAEAAIDAIERGGGKVIGLIFNKRRFHMPKWLYRRL